MTFLNILAQRKWRTSLLAPPGGHLMVTLIKCGSTHFVRTFLQEYDIKVLNCSSYCPWGDFRDALYRMKSWCAEDTCSGTSQLKNNNLLLIGILTLISTTWLI